MKRLAAMLAALALALAVPTLALAQLGPTNIPAPLTQTDDSDAEVLQEEDTGLTTMQLVLIFGGAVGVIALIGFVIMRDARSAAPGAERTKAKGREGDPALAGIPKNKATRDREREQARKRARAKAARNQRKRNRPR